MKVLIACEESQEVCKAFRALGHEAYSCDIQDCSGGHPEWHIKDDVLNHLNDGWDLMVGTYISYAGTSHWNKPGRLQKRLKALEFFAALWEAPIEKICLENPKSCASPTIAKYTQEIQPYYFGDPEMKTTWLWLKNLPLLTYQMETTLFDLQSAAPKPEPFYVDYTGKKRYFTDAIGGYHGEGNSTLRRAKTFPGMPAQWLNNGGRQNKFKGIYEKNKYTI